MSLVWHPSCLAFQDTKWTPSWVVGQGLFCITSLVLYKPWWWPIFFLRSSYLGRGQWWSWRDTSLTRHNICHLSCSFQSPQANYFPCCTQTCHLHLVTTPQLFFKSCVSHPIAPLSEIEGAAEGSRLQQCSLQSFWSWVKFCFSLSAEEETGDQVRLLPEVHLCCRYCHQDIWTSCQYCIYLSVLNFLCLAVLSSSSSVKLSSTK